MTQDDKILVFWEGMFGKSTYAKGSAEGFVSYQDFVKRLSETLNLAVIEARIDERESMKFITRYGEETQTPYLAYRYTSDGLLVDWDTRTKDLEYQKQALTGEGE